MVVEIVGAVVTPRRLPAARRARASATWSTRPAGSARASTRTRGRRAQPRRGPARTATRSGCRRATIVAATGAPARVGASVSTTGGLRQPARPEHGHAGGARGAARDRAGDRRQDHRVARGGAVRDGRRAADAQARRREDVREAEGPRRRSAEVPRSGWLAVGAVAAAWSAPASAGPWLSRSSRPRPAVLSLRRRPGRARRRGPGWSRCVGSAALLARMAPAWRPARRRPPPCPDGRGPWTFVVETPSGRRATASRPRRCARSTRPAPAFRVAATLPGYPAVAPGDVVTIDGPIRPRPDRRTAPTSRGSAPSARSRPLDRRSQRPPGRRRARLEGLRQAAGDRAGRGPARAGGRPRGRDPDRPARPRRSRPRRGVHHGRREPRRRDLRLEHRDRRGGRRRRSPGGCGAGAGRS